MNILRLMLLTAALPAFITSCSKEKAGPDRAKMLRNTVWAGSYRYTSGEYTSPQPFSLKLADDGTVTWYDVVSTRPAGTWSVTGDTITITFPNTTKISATVSDQTWLDFKGGASAGVVLIQVEKSAPATTASIINTSWAGTMGGSSVTIKILSATELSRAFDGGPPNTFEYTVEGGGIRFNDSAILPGINYALISGNTTIMEGIERRVGFFSVSYIPFNTHKF